MGCFRCESWNGSNPECEDTFNSTAAFLKGFYEQNCMSYMKSRNGLYPATACVKIKGKISKCLYFLSIKIQILIETKVVVTFYLRLRNEFLNLR